MPFVLPHARRLAATLLAFALLPALPAHADPAPAAIPEGFVLAADSADAIPGSYIVVLNDPVAPQSLVGDNLTRTYDSLPAFAAHLSPLAARRLAANPAVAIVEQDQKIKISGTQRRPGWNLDRIDQRSRALSTSYTPSDDGNSVHAYVIDTGIRITHQQFRGRASYGYDFVDGDPYASDCNGHGTHVAGTLGGSTYGVAKGVKLVSVRVLDCDGDGYTSDVIDGVDWVTSHAVHPAVANLSLSGGHSAALDYAVEESIASGVTYAVAAGNAGESAYYNSPADVPEAITVAATDSRDRRPYWSNYGSYVDLFAPGTSIKSAGVRSNTATATMSGTSMAAPHVAGAAALVLDAYPKFTPAQVRAYLVTHATTGKVTALAGSPNRLLFIPAPPKAPVIATHTLAAAVGQTFSAQLKLAAGRRGSWSLAVGTLPTGLKLTSNGILYGTPTAPVARTITVRFVDYIPYAVTRKLIITVRLTAPTIKTTSLPVATAGQSYGTRLAVTDGRRGTWTAVGPLPAGLGLSATGYLSGVPSGIGSLSVPVRFTDAWNQNVVRTLLLSVATGAPPSGITIS